LVKSDASLARFDLAGDTIVFGTGDDVALYEVIGIRVRSMIDDAMCCGVIYPRESLQIIGRGVIDADGALLFDSLNDTLSHSFGIACSRRSGASRLLPNFVGTSLVRSATSKGYER
jgi:hypothetical protein